MNALRSYDKYIKPISIALAGFLGTYALAGCAEATAQIDTTKSVVVESHEYDDPDSGNRIIHMGKGRVIIIPTYDPEHFIFHVRQCDFDQSFANVDDYGCVRSSWYVPKDIYDSTSDGDEVFYDDVTIGQS